MEHLFPKRLREIRESKGLSQTDFAEKIGISRASLSYYENGTRTPDIYLLRSIHEATGVSVYYMLGLIDTKDDRFPEVRNSLGLTETTLQLLEMDTSTRLQAEKCLPEEYSDIIPKAINSADIINSLLDPKLSGESVLQTIYEYLFIDFEDSYLPTFNNKRPNRFLKTLSVKLNGIYGEEWHTLHISGKVLEEVYLDLINNELRRLKDELRNATPAQGSTPTTPNDPRKDDVHEP